MTYALGVDLGTTYSAAAVARDGRVELCTLGTMAPAIASVVVLRSDGEVLVGEAAERRALSEPTRTGREFKRRLGDPTPLVLGGTPYGAEALMAHLLKSIVALVSEREGGPPATIVLTHPANYGPYKLGLLAEAARLAGLDLGLVRYVSEPEAAAISYASTERVEVGELVAVYDFGGGTFDAAMVRRTDDGFEIVGTPEGMERMGGIDIDAAVLAHVNDALDGMLSDLDTSDAAVRTAVGRLRDDCRQAKEALSSDTDTIIPIALPGLQTEVRLTREELEAIVRPRLGETVEALRRVVDSAGLAMDDVGRVLLVGGSSRMPLVGQLVREATGRPVAMDAHPKLAIACGAALLGDAQRVAAPVASPVPASPVAPAVAPPVGPPASPVRPEPAERKRRVVPIALGAFVGIGVGVAAIVVLTSRDEAEPGATSLVAAEAGPASTDVGAGAGVGTAAATTAPGGSTTGPATDAPPAPTAPSAAGDVVTFAGSGVAGTAGEGGPATAAALGGPRNVGVSSSGDVFVADDGTQRILVVSGGLLNRVYPVPPAVAELGTFGLAVAPDDSVWFSNNAGVHKLEDGTAVAVLTDEFVRGAQFGLAFDRTGNLYVAERDGHRVLQLDLTGALSIVAGIGTAGSGDGDGDGGPATAASLAQPFAVAVDSAGNVYVAERASARVRRIAPDGTISTFAGGGTVESALAVDGTPGSDVRFASLDGLAIDADDRVYVSDGAAGLVMRFDKDGMSEHVVDTDLDQPSGLAVGQGSTLYIVDGLTVRRWA